MRPRKPDNVLYRLFIAVDVSIEGGRFFASRQRLGGCNVSSQVIESSYMGVFR